MAKPPQNIAASVRARLLNYARENRKPFDQILTRFALERLLYRLSQSPYHDQFVLKGAMLLTTWFDEPGRPTRDIDLLGFGEHESEALLEKFSEILAIDAEDGIEFSINDLRVDRIRDELEYGGARLRTKASLDGACISITIDIGFGDSIEPGLEDLEYPSLLNLPAPKMRAYAQETVIAEKFQAIVMLGNANTRLKDYFDIWLISQNAAFDDDQLAHAIAATFARRKTEIPKDIPDGLDLEFAQDTAKLQQWETFKNSLSIDPGDLSDIVTELAQFLMPHALRAIEMKQSD